jgi:nucleoside-diphosphate-sugar epimerase
MKILVAGGAGFIGSRLVEALSNAGHDVTVLDLLWFGNHVKKYANIVRKDIFDIDENFLKRFDQVIFLAGVSNDPMADYSPQINFIYNAACPAYLAYISKKAGVKRFIYGSSCSVYGNRGDTLSVETDNVTSRYPYGISKLQGEMAVMGMSDENFSVICFRQGTVCGYSPRMRFDLVVNTMYMKAMTEGVITVHHADIWRPILAISDAVEAYLAAVKAKQSISGVFNVSSMNITVGEIAKTVQGYFKRSHNKTIRIDEQRIKNFRNYRVSVAKAKRVLGVRFRGTVENILAEIDGNISKKTDFSQDKFYNINMFKRVIDKKKLLIR